MFTEEKTLSGLTGSLQASTNKCGLNPASQCVHCWTKVAFWGEERHIYPCCVSCGNSLGLGLEIAASAEKGVNLLTGKTYSPQLIISAERYSWLSVFAFKLHSSVRVNKALNQSFWLWGQSEMVCILSLAEVVINDHNSEN